MPTKDEVIKARLERGLTQEAAADKAGICTSTWRNWESGRTPVKPGAWELFLLKTKKFKRAVAPTQGEKK